MTIETEFPAVKVLEHEHDGPEDLHRAANALLNTLWQTAYSGSRSFEENWLEMDRRFPQARWLHNELKSAALVPSTPAESRCEELVKALEFYADEKNWSDGGFSNEDGPNVLTLVMCSTDNDRGEIARATLKELRATLAWNEGVGR